MDGALVEDLNERARGEGLVASLRMARLILDAFFDGDLARWREVGATDPHFRALLAHPDLEPSQSALWYALAVQEQCEALPPQIAYALPLSHHRMLLPIEPPEERAILARKAVAQQWSRRRLADAIRDLGRPTRARGRPRTPAIVHVARKIHDGLGAAEREAIDLATLHRFGKEKSLEAIRALRRDLDALAALASEIEGAVERLPDDL